MRSDLLQFTLSFSGELADEHRIDLYDVSQAIIGFQRSVALTTHLVLNQKIITQAPSLKGAEILAFPPTDGSWKINTAVILTSLYGLGEQYKLEQYSAATGQLCCPSCCACKAGGRVGCCAGLVVAVTGVEAGQVQFVVDQMVQCVLEGAGEQLPLQINGNEARAGVNGFVAGHARLQYELHIRHLLFHWVHSRMRLWNYFFYNFVRQPPWNRSLVMPT